MKKAIRPSTKKSTGVKINMQDVFFKEILDKIELVDASQWEHYIKVNFDLAPKNAFTNYLYRRLNRINLMLDMVLNNRTTPRYATFKQISDRGGLINKGSKGLLIEFFSWSIKHKETGKSITIKEYKALSVNDKKTYNVFPISRFYRVFNLDDVDTTNMNFSIEVEETEEIEILDNENIENYISSIVSSKDLVINHQRAGVASYNRITDHITMPLKEICVSMDRYYATLFHEIIHWTGASNRLNRIKGAKFADHAYSFEELIAELGSMLITLDFNLNSEFINSLRYLKGWSRTSMDNRESEFKSAFIQAQTAVAFLSR